MNGADEGLWPADRTKGGLYGLRAGDGERWCGSFILPPFQRPPAWTLRQKQLLIESVYAGLPIGAIVVNDTTNGDPCDGWLLDGQRQVAAIVEYVTGDFSVCGWRYSDLPDAKQRHFRRTAVVVLETNERDPTRCREIYQRLAHEETAHD